MEVNNNLNFVPDNAHAYIVLTNQLRGARPLLNHEVIRIGTSHMICT